MHRLGRGQRRHALLAGVPAGVVSVRRMRKGEQEHVGCALPSTTLTVRNSNGTLQTFFFARDGTCAACPPPGGSFLDRYRGLFELLAAVIGAAAVIAAALVFLVRSVGGSLSGTGALAVGLVQWAVLTVQTLAQAAAPASSYALPPLVASLFRWLQVLEVQGLSLPPACIGGYPFATEVTVCAASVLLLLGTCGVWVFVAPASKLRIAGRVMLVLTLILYPATVRYSVSMLNCTPIVISTSAVAALDGGSGAPASTSRGDTARLLVLSSNPAYVCWSRSGAHLPAGVLAVIAALVVGLGLPLAALVGLQSDPWLSSTLEQLKRERTGRLLAPQSASRSRCVSPLASSTGAASADNATLTVTLSPLFLLKTRAATDALQKSTGAALPRACIPDPLLAPFLNDYTPTAWYTKHLDIALALSLAVLEALLPRPSTLALAITKASCIAAATLSLCVHILVMRPFAAMHAWKGRVRALILVMSAGCAAINAGVSAIYLGLDSPRLATALEVGAYVLLCTFGVTILVLVISVGRAMYAGARDEQRDVDARLLAATRTTSRKLTSQRRMSALADRQRQQGHYDGLDAESGEAGDSLLSSGTAPLAFLNPLHATGDIDGGAEPPLQAAAAAHARGFAASGDDAGRTLGFAVQPLVLRRSARQGRTQSSRRQRGMHASARDLAALLVEPSSADPSLLCAACDAVASLSPEIARDAGGSLLPVLSSCVAQALRGGSPLHGAVVAAMCRAMALLTDHAGDGAALDSLVSPDLPVALATVLAAPESSAQALSHACWLVGNLAAHPATLGAFIAARGLHATVGLLGRVGTAGGSSLGDSLGARVAADDDDVPLQCLVALCSIAEVPAGAAALVDKEAAVAGIVGILARHDAFNVAVIVAGCRALDVMLTGGGDSGGAPASHSRLSRQRACADLVSHGGLHVLLDLAASPRACADNDVALHVTRACLGVLSCGGEVGRRAAAEAGAAGAAKAVDALLRACPMPPAFDDDASDGDVPLAADGAAFVESVGAHTAFVRSMSESRRL